ncbi:clathrin adaptor, sigma subunit/coatomer, zeta subunit [Tilletiopsis washingtonensis]|uniref:Clathrin adaptor, sigma subunit/coatomer, zeta subunit n=1 Tax=Tilletiopsis washingtonensis TaxID=58919 RepID=A0A316ZAZ8_9BASI|nr:clathrin adaptor, sigma subunit/coatomer, zeta subunit [Tilletiopsis washingtonensis]PWN98198.1 clathrin adaptor, sigma subunit/coatomer, zeta subunit [Tilletiopsis washingtonensis]
MAIKAFLIFNNKSQIRLVSIYAPLAAPVQTALVRRIQARVFSSGTDGTAAASSSSRRQTGTELPDAEADSNFLDASDLAQVFEPRAEEDEEAQGRKEVLEEERDGSGDGDGWLLVWRNYATLYFVCVVDGSESPLGILDLIQVFVEALDQCFENVCELDLIFHFDEVHAILSEVLQGGLVLETSLPAICAAASASAKARKKSAAAGSVAAALPGLADWVAPAGAAAGAWGEGWRRELGRFTGR